VRGLERQTGHRPGTRSSAATPRSSWATALWRCMGHEFNLGVVSAVRHGLSLTRFYGHQRNCIRVRW